MARSALARWPLVLGGLWLVSLVPLAYYMIIALLFTLDLVYCAPDAYECPV